MSKRTTSRGKEVFKQCVAPKRPGNQHKAFPGKPTIPSMVLFSLFLMSSGVVFAATTCPEGSTLDSVSGACVFPDATTEVTEKSTAFVVDGDITIVGNKIVASSSDITVRNGTLQLGLGDDSSINHGGILQSVTLENSVLKVLPVLYEEKTLLEVPDAKGFYIKGFKDDQTSEINLSADSYLLIDERGDSYSTLHSSVINQGNLYLYGDTIVLENTFTNEVTGQVEVYSELILSNSNASTGEFALVNKGIIKTNKEVNIRSNVLIETTGSFINTTACKTNDFSTATRVTGAKLTDAGKVIITSLSVESGGAVNVKSNALLYVDSVITSDDGAVNLEDGATFVARFVAPETTILRIGDDQNVRLYLGEKAYEVYQRTNNSDPRNEAHYRLDDSGISEQLFSQYDKHEYYYCYSCQAPDTGKTSDFGVTTPGGKVGGLDVYSGNNLIEGNRTWAMGADTTVLKNGLIQTYDAGYLLKNISLTIDDGGKVEVLTDIGIASNQDPCEDLGSFVINGSVINNGTFDAADGYEVYIGSTGSFTASGSNTRSKFNKLIIDGGFMGIENGASMTVQELGSEDASSLGKLIVTGYDTTVTVTTPGISNNDITVTSGAFLGLGVTKEEANALDYIGQNKAVLALKSEHSLNVGKSIVKVGTVPESVNLETGDLYFAKDSVFIVDLPTIPEGSTHVPVILEGDPDKDGSIYVEKGAKLVINTYSYGRTQLTDHLHPKLEADAWEGDDLIYEKGESTNISLVKESGNLYLEVTGESTGYSTGTGGESGGGTGNGEGSSNGSGNGGKSNEAHDTSIQGLSENFGLPEVINGLIDTNEGAAIRVTNADKADIQLINRLLSPTYFGNDQGEIDVQWSSKVWNSISNIGAVSGVNAYSLDMNRQIVEVIESHAGSDTEKAQDRNLWIQVLGNTAQADSLKAQLPSKIGYKSKSYGFIFGADVLNSYDASVGIAFNYVKGDLDSKGNYVKTDSDAKIWGLNLYGSKQFGPAKISAMFSYQSSDGKATQSFTDLSGNGYAVRSDLDSKSIVFGVRGEYGFDLGKAAVKPHAGLRYSYTNFDDSSVNINGEKAFNVSTKNKGIVSMPIGVAVEGKVQADDWRLKPTFDLSLVPQFGSKSTSETVSAQNYNGVDSVSYNVTGNFMGELALGMEAQNKAHSFSIFYKGALGDQGRSSHSLNVGYRFSF